jgi:hypothetical protein
MTEKEALKQLVGDNLEALEKAETRFLKREKRLMRARARDRVDDEGGSGGSARNMPSMSTTSAFSPLVIHFALRARNSHS